MTCLVEPQRTRPLLIFSTSPPCLESLSGRPLAPRLGLRDTEGTRFPQYVRIARPVLVYGSITHKRFHWISGRWMSTRQKPLPASCVYFDRQRYSLGLPRIAQGLDRLDSCSLWAWTWPSTRPGTWSRMAPTSMGRCLPVMNRP